MAEPLPICLLNGALVPLREARISPLDRGFLFGDGVYEVIAVHRGHAPRLTANVARLTRSLQELKIRNPHSAAAWSALIQQLIAANGSGDLYVYLQVSRGAEHGRNHAPLPDIAPTIFGFCAPLPVTTPAMLADGIPCITATDMRWARCDIKTTNLLANVLHRQQALDTGATEAILLRDGWLTDASGSAVHVVIGGEIRTPPYSTRLLPGTTRGWLEELALAHQLPARSTPVSEAELRSADEIWLSAATRGVIAVTLLDGLAVGSGKPGPVFRRMHALLNSSVHET